VTRYQGKLSGPLLDRIDPHVEVPNLPADDVLRAPVGEASIHMRARCTAAPERALVRQRKTNQALVGQEIDLFARIDVVTSQLLRTAAARLGWSGRGVHRTLKVARTIADLAGCEEIALAHAAEAMQYRHSGPNTRCLNRPNHRAIETKSLKLMHYERLCATMKPHTGSMIKRPHNELETTTH
jgi:magnesium chelatase family protein